MEALAVFGIACNVIQVINFAHETTSLCKRVYQTGSLDCNLAENGLRLGELSRALAEQLSTHSQPLTRSDKALLDIANKCTEAARNLCDEVAFLSLPKDKPSLRAVVANTAKTAWRKRRLERLEKNMVNYQKTMEMGVLLRVKMKMDALQLQQQEDFDKLDATLRAFIQQVAAGQTSLSQLVIHESTAVKAHITTAATQIVQAVETHVSERIASNEQSVMGHIGTTAGRVESTLSNQMRQMDLQANDERVRERFLASLKFPEMNARRNQVPTSFPRTFFWVLNIEDEYQSDEESSNESSEDVEQDRDEYQSDEESSNESSEEVEPDWDDLIEWLESDHKLYWISGKPGSGKSTLMKFIISRNETMDALSRWRPGTRILSHFLWSPGQNMQRNIKGTLCSLLYQAVESNKDATYTLLEAHKHLCSKDYPSDWAAEELEAALFEFFRISNQPFCIFLDGLDEIGHDEGPDAIIELVFSLQMAPKIKFCVASRPEPAFKRRFSNYPSLRIHELTTSDLRLYAEHELSAPLAGRLDWDEAPRIIETVVRRAEGVFFWLVLVIKSLRRGLANGDSQSEIEARLRTMPADLARLFEDMWLRLNEDCDIYRQDAAFYFHLVLASNKLHPGACLFSYGRKISIFDLAVAKDDTIQSTVAEISETVSLDLLKQKCECVVRDLDTRCGGLLQPRPALDSDRSDDPDAQFLEIYCKMGVDFVHRSAYDFISDTPTGQSILRAQNLTWEDAFTRLFTASLFRCRLRTAKIPAAPNHIPQDFIIWLGSEQRNGVPHTTIYRLLSLCQQWYSDFEQQNQKSEPAFFVCAAREGLASSVQMHLEAPRHAPWNPRYLSNVLQGACALSDAWIMPRGPLKAERFQLIRNLLCLGADPNSRQHILQPSDWLYARPDVGELSSPFGVALKSLLGLQHDTAEIFMHELTSLEILATLEHFIRFGARLDDRVFVVVSIITGENALLKVTAFDWATRSYTKVILEANLCLLLLIVLAHLHPDVRPNSQLAVKTPVFAR